MDKLFTLLDIQRQAQESANAQALSHIMVNETRKIVPYEQAVFWRHNGLAPVLEKISGNMTLDPDGEYGANIKKIISAHIAAHASSAPIFEQGGIIMPLRTECEGLLGGLWLERKDPPNEAETRILEELAITYAGTLALHKLRARKGFASFGGEAGRLRRYIAAAVVILALLPVRMNIAAPAEIVPREAEIVTAPFEGMIEKINVQPGDAVKAGDVVATMEHQSLQAQMDMAEQELAIVRSGLSRAERESLAAPERKAGLLQMQQEIQSKRIALNYARDLRDKSELRAGRDGVAVFADAHTLRGRPVAPGDKIMMIADPADAELLIRVPADAMVPVKPGAGVRFFLNVSPLSGRNGKIRNIGYQASPDPDGLLTYKIIADVQKNKKLRVGWRGTARIDGPWTVLSYAILRRPLIALRNLAGI